MHKFFIIGRNENLLKPCKALLNEETTIINEKIKNLHTRYLVDFLPVNKRTRRKILSNRRTTINLLVMENRNKIERSLTKPQSQAAKHILARWRINLDGGVSPEILMTQPTLKWRHTTSTAQFQDISSLVHPIYLLFSSCKYKDYFLNNAFILKIKMKSQYDTVDKKPHSHRFDESLLLLKQKNRFEECSF